jgi:hypothetical protein
MRGREIRRRARARGSRCRLGSGTIRTDRGDEGPPAEASNQETLLQRESQSRWWRRERPAFRPQGGKAAVGVRFPEPGKDTRRRKGIRRSDGRKPGRDLPFPRSLDPTGAIILRRLLRFAGFRTGRAAAAAAPDGVPGTTGFAGKVRDTSRYRDGQGEPEEKDQSLFEVLHRDGCKAMAGGSFVSILKSAS